MFSFGKSKESKPSESEPATSTSKNKAVIDKIFNNKYAYSCVKSCFKSYVTEITEDEKICLAKCSDNIHNTLNSSSNLLIKARSFV